MLKMKNLKVIFAIIITLTIVASCSKNNNSEEAGDAYSITGTISQDSAHYDTDLKLFIDKHGSFVEETLPVLKGHFAYTGMTTGLDELYLTDSEGRTVRFLAKGGSQIDLTIDSLGTPSFAEVDSINIVYQQLVSGFEECDEKERKDYLDSVCIQYNTSILPALLIRDRMHLLNDSIHMRQCLGRISADVKPQWLVNSLEERFDRPSERLRKSKRLNPLPVMKTDIDTVTFDFSVTRQNSGYLYFWADFDQESVDSLKMLVPMAKHYGLHKYLDEYVAKEKTRRPKRIDIVTVCLHAADSAAWKEAINGLPGYHILLQAGFSDPVVKSWNIRKIPYNVVIDRFSNVLDSYQWGHDLRLSLDKAPTNFSVQLNGSKNNQRRAPRD